MGSVVEAQDRSSWCPDREITLAQLASGIREYAENASAGSPFSLPYPANLQNALNKITLLCWRHAVTPPRGVVELLAWSEQPFGEWPSSALLPEDVDLDESLLLFGAPTQSCEELGALRGDVEGEIRENRLIRSVMDKTRAHAVPHSYVAFRRLLIEQPSMSALALDTNAGRPELAMLTAELRDAYAPAPPESIADGVIRTCAGCRGLRLPTDGHTWHCVDLNCPDPSRPGPDLPAPEGAVWLRRELRMFVTSPGRAELRLAKALAARGVPFQLWPDFDTYDLALFDERPWVVDVKAWRNPTRLARRLRTRPFETPSWAERGFIVVAQEEVARSQRYVERLRSACPDLRRSGRITAVSERQFLTMVGRRSGGRA